MPTNNMLFIGPYRQNDGWGLASRDYLLSLLKYQDNITSHPLYLANNIENNIPIPILDSEKNTYETYDTIIQHCLPFGMTKRYGPKNIGLLFLENQKFNSDSVFNLNSMDEIWVSSNLEKQSLIDGGVIKPIKKASHAIDTNGLKKIDPNIKFNNSLSGTYKFYVIGEYIQRKNIKDIITAFHLEFDITEPVSLIIKTSLSGTRPKDLMSIIKNQCNSIKQSLRIRKQFHEEIIITDRLTTEQLNGLHNLCDCFIMTSYGEAFCRPIAEALCHNKYCILSSNLGINEDLDPQDFSLVDCYPQPVLLDNPSYIGDMDIYNGYETWYQPSIISIRQHMRSAFESKPKVDGSKYINKFSYETVGNNLCQLLQ
jgi:glycosyltransferase involved in cell wall biosynthesis